MGLDSELLKGTTVLLLLVLLEEGPLYDYRIAKEVEARSGGLLEVKEGALYPVLHKIERDGLVEGFWQVQDDGTRRKYYRLTGAGQRAAQRKREEWRTFVGAVGRVMGAV